MPSPCEGCAFSPGAAANREPYNELRAEICKLGAVPFWCHHKMNWKKPSVTEILASVREGHICQGWKREVAKLARTGWFRDRETRRERRLLAAKAFHLLGKFLNS